MKNERAGSAEGCCLGLWGCLHLYLNLVLGLFLPSLFWPVLQAFMGVGVKGGSYKQKQRSVLLSPLSLTVASSGYLREQVRLKQACSANRVGCLHFVFHEHRTIPELTRKGGKCRLKPLTQPAVSRLRCSLEAG